MNPLKGIQTFLSYFSTLQEHEYVGAYSPYDRIVYVRRINPPELSIICQITEGGMELPAPTPEASILYDATRRETIMQIKSTWYVTETRQR